MRPRQSTTCFLASTALSPQKDYTTLRKEDRVEAAKDAGATMKKLAVIAVMMSAMGAVAQTPAAPPPMAKPGMTLTTTAFEDGGVIPNKYTQAAESGAAVSPHLEWTNVPDGVVSFALI